MNHRELEDSVRRLLEEQDPKAAASVAIENLAPSVRGFLHALHGEDDGEDIYCMWAEDLWRGLPGFQWRCNLRAWAFLLARHASHRFLRDPWRARKQRLRTSAASRIALSAARASARLPGDERLEILQAGLAPGDRELLWLHASREMSFKEIAVVLSSEGDKVNAAAVRKRYERLKSRLEKLARDNGLLT
jgi:RNA polymerase sigma-70 factor, ECF subfamily